MLLLSLKVGIDDIKPAPTMNVTRAPQRRMKQLLLKPAVVDLGRAVIVITFIMNLKSIGRLGFGARSVRVRCMVVCSIYDYDVAG